jgi:parallel beta-helix repeat protein
MDYAGRVTVRNCKLAGFSTNVYVNRGGWNNFTSNEFNDARGSGIYTYQSSNNQFAGCNSSGNAGSGLYLDYQSSSNSFSGGQLNWNGDHGAYIRRWSNSNTIEGSEIANNADHGVHAYSYYDGNHYTLSGEVVSGNAIVNNSHGVFVYVDHGDNCANTNFQVIGNNVSSNRNNGLYFYNAYNRGDSHLVSGNTVFSNGQDGISLVNSVSNTVEDNDACMSGYRDVYCNNAQTGGTGNTCTELSCTGVLCPSSCAATPEPTPVVISACPYTISSPGMYVLDSDFGSSGTCITVTTGGSQATLDCQGHTITGPGSGTNYGIYLNAAGRVAVMNCKVTRFNTNVYVNQGGWNNFSSCELNAATGSGIYTYQSSNNQFSGCNSSGNAGCGLYFDYQSSSNSFSGGQLNWNGDHGAYIRRWSNSNTIEGSEIANNADHGVHAYSYYDGNHYTLSGEVVSGNAIVNNSHGVFVYVDHGDNCANTNFQVIGNNVSSNRNNGLYFYNAYNRGDSHLVSGNTVFSNGQDGISLVNSVSNTVEDNDACMSGYRDVYCNNAQTGGTGNTCTELSCTGVLCPSSCAATPEPTPVVISSCPYTISSPGMYVLDSDFGSSGTCITVTTGGSQATLDCQGHTITGPTSGTNYGIYLNYAGRVTVRNCKLTRFSTNVYVNRGGWNNFTGNDFYGATSTGIYLVESSNNQFSGCNSSSNSGTGLYFDYYSSSNSFTGGELNWNADHGAYFRRWSNSNTLSGNDIMNNQDYGVYAYSHYDGNHYTLSGEVISGNTVANNSHGIFLYVDHGDYCANTNFQITGNNISANRNNGLYLYNAYSRTDSHVITSNTLQLNGQNGFYAYNSAGNTVTESVMCENGHRDVYCSSAQTGGSLNTCQEISCTGVVCPSSCSPTPVPTPIEIGVCPYTIDSQGYYVLNADQPSGGSCITVNTGGSYSTIDCQGHSITGPSSGTNYGIQLVSGGHVTVKNCTVSGFQQGIYVNGAHWNNITGNTLTSNTQNGLYLGSASYNQIEGNNVVSNTQNGIYVTGSSYNNITANTACGNGASYKDITCTTAQSGSADNACESARVSCSGAACSSGCS